MPLSCICFLHFLFAFSFLFISGFLFWGVLLLLLLLLSYSVFSQFLLGIFFIYISNAISKVPYTLPRPSPQPTHSRFLALAFPCTGTYNLRKTKGLSSQRWPTRPSSDSYASRDMSSGGYWLVHIVVPPIGLQTPLDPWVLTYSSSYIRGPVIHPIADCFCFLSIFQVLQCAFLIVHVFQ